MSNEEPIYYFGYGVMSSPELIEALLGRVPPYESAVLPNHKLCIHTWEEVPTPVKAILLESWGKIDEFLSYAIRAKRGSTVSGVLWQLTAADFKTIALWNVHHEWYEPFKALVRSASGENVLALTETIPDANPERCVDGMSYPIFLNQKKKMLAVAKYVGSMSLL
jgi:hypothetical protein